MSGDPRLLPKICDEMVAEWIARGTPHIPFPPYPFRKAEEMADDPAEEESLKALQWETAAINARAEREELRNHIREQEAEIKWLYESWLRDKAKLNDLLTSRRDELRRDYAVMCGKLATLTTERDAALFKANSDVVALAGRLAASEEDGRRLDSKIADMTAELAASKAEVGRLTKWSREEYQRLCSENLVPEGERRK